MQALQDADIIIIGPGTFYTSLIPCLSPIGMMESLKNSSAKKILIANAANFPVGHCDGYDVDMYLSEFTRLL
ncbi:MAG: 2-phospho-L-lactate transferase CofD family protein [bacterium]